MALASCGMGSSLNGLVLSPLCDRVSLRELLRLRLSLVASSYFGWGCSIIGDGLPDSVEAHIDSMHVTSRVTSWGCLTFVFISACIFVRWVCGRSSIDKIWASII